MGTCSLSVTWQGALMLILLSALSFLIDPAIGQSPVCSWVETASRWSNGQRNILKLSVDQHYSGWNVTFSFDTPVTFEAWKGDVQTVDNRTFTVTNRCYNGQLYPCQCLELGYLVRHQPGYNPATTYSLNNVSAPV